MNPILNWVDNNFPIEIKQNSLIILQVPAGAQVIDGLLYKDELKNKQGKEQRNIVYQYLKSALLKDVPAQNEYKF